MVAEDEEASRPPRSHDPRCSEDSNCKALHAIVAEEGVENLYPPLDGTAFFMKICHMNVSERVIWYCVVDIFLPSLFFLNPSPFSTRAYPMSECNIPCCQMSDW